MDWAETTARRDEDHIGFGIVLEILRYKTRRVKIWIIQDSDQPLHWRHNRHDSVSNHQPHHCLLNRLFRCRSKKTSKLRVTGLCAGNSPGTGEFPAQTASNAEYVSSWWRHHDTRSLVCLQMSPNITGLVHLQAHANYEDDKTVGKYSCVTIYWELILYDQMIFEIAGDCRQLPVNKYLVSTVQFHQILIVFAKRLIRQIKDV